MESLPHDALHHIFSLLPLRQIIICRCVSKHLHSLLTSPSFLSSPSPPLPLLALRPHHHHHHHPLSSPPSLHVFDPSLPRWLRLPLDFLLPFRSPHPVAASSSSGLLFLWADSPSSSKSLLLCNPLTRLFRPLPPLGSAWSRHGSVLVDSSSSSVMVLTELAALYFSPDSPSNQWLKFSSNLPSKPRSPVLTSRSVFALCDVGSPWRSQWKLFSSTISMLRTSQTWSRLDKLAWGDVFDILKRPRLVKGNAGKLLMVGGLKSSFSLNSPCSTILILRLDLESWEWDEAGRMPVDMFKCFQECSKLKVFGGGDRVCFSAKRLGKLALWDNVGGKGEWQWIEGVPGGGDGLCRGFVFQARLTPLP